MSLKAMSAPRASVFTFESTVHSSHVLRCLDDQRRRDVLCDVTVVVEGQSFRAHRSVLASCSEYFTQRISSLTQHGAVITLPQEVTAAGFEPLLKFAYTSKLLFDKDNVLEMRNSASVLGFRDLDEACFDFLLPKFFSSTKGSVPCPRKTCCKKKYKRQLSKTDSCTDSDVVLLDEKEVKPVDDSSSQQEGVWPCRKSESSKLGSQNSGATLDTAAEGANNGFMQCPKYRKFQLACGKDACVVAKSLAATIKDECGLPCSPCSSGMNSKNETEKTNPAKLRDNGAEERQKTEIHDKKIDVNIREDEKDTTEREGTLDDIMKMEEEHFAGVSSPDRSSVDAVSSGEGTRLGERSPGLILHHCLPRASAGGPVMSRSQGQQRLVMDLKDDKKTQESCEEEPVSIFQRAEEQAEGEGERGIMDRVTLPVNNAREGSTMGSDEGSSDPDTGQSSNTGSGQLQATSVNWLKLHANLSSRGSDCPFLQDLDQSKCLWKGAGVSECTSHSGVSSLNSGEDSETETEGDSEAYTRERARQVQLPFSVDWIVDLSRNDFQQLLKQQSFTQEQLEFVHDMRRRSKNRQAAQRCRKRKLDCIYNLQCEINKLKTEREKLIVEKSQLSQLKVTTGHSVSALCQRVCSEANLQPEQLQVLAKYMSPDCPLTSLFPHIDTLLSKSRSPLP